MKPLNRKSFLFLAALLAISTITMAGCAGDRLLVKPYEKENFIHYSQVKGWDETKSMNNYVVYVNRGDTIPLALSMDTDFMDFKQDHIDIVAKKKIYFKVEMPDNLTAEELSELSRVNAETISEWSDTKRKAFFKNYMLHVSTDAIHWAPLYSIKSIREVFGYKKGTISFAVMAGTTDGLEGSFNMKTVK